MEVPNLILRAHIFYERTKLIDNYGCIFNLHKTKICQNI